VEYFAGSATRSSDQHLCLPAGSVYSKAFFSIRLDELTGSR
jgi:hypothetical protein